MSEDGDGDSFAESGILKRLQLINFLNHANLEIDFCPNVNFIIGKNGSGKSAVLLGICACFGANAKQTGRSGNLEGLIRDQEAFARVSVTLKNEGQFAFYPACYGTEITIQREIRRKGQGVGGWKLFGESKREVKRDRNVTIRDELKRILHHFNIQYDNPCVMMTQDVSKEFLANQKENGGAAAKFAFFERATLLTDMRNKNAEIEAASSKMEKQKEGLAEEFKAKKEAYNKLKEKFEKAQKIGDLAAKKAEIRSKYLWAKAAELEDQFDASELGLNKCKEKHDKVMVFARCFVFDRQIWLFSFPFCLGEN